MDLSFLTNPIFIISVGIPTAIAVWQFGRDRVREPKEMTKLGAETRAAEAQATAAILQSVETVTRLISEVREEAVENVMGELKHLKETIEVRMAEVEAKLDRHMEHHAPPEENNP